MDKIESAESLAPEFQQPTELIDKAATTKERVQHGVKKMAEQARTQTAVAVEKQKTTVANQVGGLASVLHKTAEQLNEQQQASLASYAQGFATRLDDMAGALHDRSLSSLLEQTQDFARRQPGLFLAGTVIAGLVLARFLKSSTHHEGSANEYSNRTPSLTDTYPPFRHEGDSYER